LLGIVQTHDDQHGRRGWSAVARLLPALAWLAVIVALTAVSDLPRVPGVSNDAVELGGHFVFFAVLAALVQVGLRHAGWFGEASRLAVAFLMVVAVGFGTEVLQAYLPDREAARVDLAADALGAWIGVLGGAWIGRRRGQDGRSPVSE